MVKKKNDLIALLGLLASFGSWGYTVLNPQPQLIVGLILIGIAFVCAALLIVHLFDLRVWGGLIVFAVVSALFWLYSSKTVITPAYKRELLSQLQEGYGLREECGSRQYYDETPRFMGDAEERWMADVHTTLKHTGKVDDLQMWEQSDIVGLAKDSNLIGFRCTRMATKTGALGALTHSSGELRRKRVGKLGKIELFQHFTRSSSSVRGGHSSDLEKQGGILLARSPRQKPIGLRHIGEPSATIRNIFPINKDRTGRWIQETADDVEKGALSATARAKDRYDLPRSDSDRHASNRSQFPPGT